ncbi:helix-turn-helix domain-containing protein [Planobispora rosea]|nr:helix-turn-helix domain-containing protein [Planobispora rosea]
MRYGQRGGYTPAEQERRELVRLKAAERFAAGEPTKAIAGDLRIDERTVRRWNGRCQVKWDTVLLRR